MKRKKSCNRIILSFVLAVVLVFNAFGILPAFAEENSIISFPDAILEQALIDAGADTNGDKKITEGELALLTGALSLKSLAITDLTGLEYAGGISALDVSDNQIRSIAPLLGLTLTSLDVTNNYLDIADGSADRADIGVLAGLGCTVSYTPQKVIPASGVSLDAAALEMCPGDTKTLTAAVVPVDAANQTIIWASADNNIATVTDGIVTAVSIGTAAITATTQDGGFVAECAVSVKSPVIATSVYTIDSALLKGVTKMTSPGQLKANLENAQENLVVYKPDGALCESGYAGTGATVKLVIGGTVRDTVTVLVAGDTNGDGMISVTDYTRIRIDIQGIKPLENVFRTAADIDGNAMVAVTDYTKIRLDIQGIKPISSFTPDLPEVSDPRIRAFLDIALAQQGKPYVWSMEGPDSFDCSGYIYYCLTQANYSSYYPYPAYKKLYRATANTYSAWASWQYVDRNSLQPGDLMFYLDDDGVTIGHIGIYLGNGYHIHASSSYGCVIICRIDGWYNERLSHGRRAWY
ncbi:MAG: NlpC/P60 family protein [Christensenellales bacterium]